MTIEEFVSSLNNEQLTFLLSLLSEAVKLHETEEVVGNLVECAEIAADYRGV